MGLSASKGSQNSRMYQIIHPHVHNSALNSNPEVSSDVFAEAEDLFAAYDAAWSGCSLPRRNPRYYSTWVVSSSSSSLSDILDACVASPTFSDDDELVEANGVMSALEVNSAPTSESDFRVRHCDDYITNGPRYHHGSIWRSLSDATGTTSAAFGAEDPTDSAEGKTGAHCSGAVCRIRHSRSGHWSSQVSLPVAQ